LSKRKRLKKKINIPIPQINSPQIKVDLSQSFQSNGILEDNEHNCDIISEKARLSNVVPV